MATQDFPLNNFRPDPISDTQSRFGALRAQSPAYGAGGYRDPRFSSDRTTPFFRSKLSGLETNPLMRRAFDVLAGWTVFRDKADHRRLRTLVNKVFTDRSVTVLHGRVDALGYELTDAVPSLGGPAIGSGRQRDRPIEVRSTYLLPGLCTFIA